MVLSSYLTSPLQTTRVNQNRNGFFDEKYLAGTLNGGIARNYKMLVRVMLELKVIWAMRERNDRKDVKVEDDEQIQLQWHSGNMNTSTTEAAEDLNLRHPLSNGED